MILEPIEIARDAPCVLVACSDRDEWLEERYKGIGGSDASTTLGVNPWMSNDRLWEEKTGRIIPEDISDNEAVKYGTEAEEPLRVLFALDYPQYQVRHTENALLRNKSLPFLQVSLDGQLIDGQGRHGVLEIKTTTIRQAYQWRNWNNKVPQNYYCQLLHAMLVTGFEFAVLKVQIKSTYEDEERISIKHYHFERKDEIESMKVLLRAERRFWTYVEKDERPPLILPSI